MKRIASFYKSRKLQHDILFVFSSLISVICAFIIWFTHTQNSKLALSLASNLMELTSKNILDKTEDFLSDIQNQSKMADALYSNLKDFSANKEILSSYIFEMLKLSPYIEQFEIGTEEGDLVSLGRVGVNQTYLRDPSKHLPTGSYYMIRTVERKKDIATDTRSYASQDGEILDTEIITNSNYDPRLRIWYEAAVRTKIPFWSDIYTFTESHRLGINFSLPIFSENKEMIGASGTKVSLELLSSFLSNLAIGKSGRACIFDKNGHLLASSAMSQNEQGSSSSLDKVFREIYEIFTLEHQRLFFRTINGVNYIGSVVPFPLYTEGWFVGIIAPTDEFLGKVKRASEINIIISIGIIILSWIPIVYFSRRISVPILKITKEAEKIKQFDLDDEVKIDTPISEIQLLRDSLSSMKMALKSFSYYIPKDIVRQLIEKGQDIRLGGEKKEIAIFFIDLVNFSEITESLPMDQFMPQFFEFLNELSQVIIQCKGTIDKYIGDNIMAFWGAPQELEDRDIQACRAAILCQNKLEELNQKWQSKGQVELTARIGINSGQVIVGNIGTEQRINYTVIGDPVNLASRIEQINKTYGTKIMISEIVLNKIEGKFLTRPIDIVHVKGKHEKIKIYELIGMFKSDISIAPTNDQINLSEEFTKAFEAYHQGLWESSLQMFEAINKRFPFDQPTHLYIQRCKDHLKNF